MRKLLTLSFLSLALLVTTVASPAALAATGGDVTLPWSKLTQMGVSQALFRLMCISGNGHVLLAAEKEKDYSLRKKGIVYKTRILRSSGSSITMDTLVIPVNIWDQCAINDTGSQAIVVGELGTKILEVDLDSKSIRTLMEHQKDKPGFRCDPRIAWHFNDSYYMIGYFYEADGTASPSVVVRLNLTKSGLDQFEKVLDLAHLEKKICQQYMERIVMSPERTLFIAPLQKIGKQDLILADKGEAKVLDSALVYGTLAASDNRAVYSLRTVTKPHFHEAWVQDFKTGQKWKVGDKDIPYNYAFISGDGKTIAVSRMNLATQKMSWYYGHDSDGYKLKPLPSLQNVGFGNFRFSNDGTGWAWLDHFSLRMGIVPQ